MVDFRLPGGNDSRRHAEGTHAPSRRQSRRRRRRIADLLERLEDRTLLAFTPIAQPDTAYVTGTTNLTSGFPADGVAFSSISDGTETVTLSNSLNGGTVPTTFPTWGPPPATESATPRVLQTSTAVTSETLTLSHPASTFGFELEPATGGAQSVTATFLEGSTTVGAITQSPSSASGALLFAAATDQAFTSVQLSIPAAAAGFAIAQPRYALASSALTLGKTVAATQVNPGGTLTYTLTVNNTGPNDAINAVVSDPLPMNMTFLSAPNVPAGWTESDPGVGHPGTVQFTNPLLPHGTAATFTINATVDPATAVGTVLSDTGTAVSDTSTMVMSNTASATVALVVTNTGDSGVGSLRQAILDADTSTTPVTITFAIQGTAPFDIAPMSSLPPITNQVTLDATTQPGFNPANPPLVQIDGSTHSLSGDGLVLMGTSAASSIVKGLAITGFSHGAGIHIETNHVSLTGDFLGVGLSGLPNVGNQVGVEVDGASGTTIGGTAAGAPNTIGQNANAGVEITAGATGNDVSGNFIGTDSTATNHLGNAVGVLISGASSNTVDGGNTISFNATGIQISQSATNNAVSGNTLSNNTVAGVLIDTLSNSNTVGGTMAGAGNTISANPVGVMITALRAITSAAVTRSASARPRVSRSPAQARPATRSRRTILARIPPPRSNWATTSES